MEVRELGSQVEKDNQFEDILYVGPSSLTPLSPRRSVARPLTQVCVKARGRQAPSFLPSLFRRRWRRRRRPHLLVLNSPAASVASASVAPACDPVCGESGLAIPSIFYPPKRCDESQSSGQTLLTTLIGHPVIQIHIYSTTCSHIQQHSSQNTLEFNNHLTIAIDIRTRGAVENYPRPLHSICICASPLPIHLVQICTL